MRTPGGQRRPDRLGEDLAVDDARDRGAREVVDAARRPAGAAGTRGLVRAARLGGERLAGGLGVASGCWVSANAPLWTIARWNSPRERRETSRSSTETPPADWPGDRDVVRVSAELRDVAPDPAQGGDWSIRP